MTEDISLDQALEEAIKQDLGVGTTAEADPVAAPAAPVQAAAEAAPVAREAAEPPVETPAWARERVFKHNGQEVKVVPSSEEEELALIRQGYDYTRKTMELAQQRQRVETWAKELQTADQQRQAEMRQLLTDPNRLETYLNALRGNTGHRAPQAPAHGEDSDELISRSEARRLAEEAQHNATQAARREVDERARAIKQEVEIDRMAIEYQRDFDTTIANLVSTQYPLLSEFGPEDIGSKIKAQGHAFLQARAMLQPGVAVDPAEIKAAMVDYARRESERYEGRLREREKKFAVQRSEIVQRGTEPRGGQAPSAPVPAKLSLKDPALDAQVLAEIESIMGRG